MDRERAKELLPIIQAYAEGEEIEYRWISDDDGPDGAWITPDREFESGGEYRIKPEPFECWVFVDEYDKVKVVYHPDFISPTNSLFGMEYNQFVRGCHLGVFPSLYEPWGYTPLECLASAVPAVTSNLSGFGDYILKNVTNLDKKAIFVVDNKNKDFYGAAQQLADQLYSFARLNRRQRIEWRNKAESSSVHFDWNNLISYYDRAYHNAWVIKH